MPELYQPRLEDLWFKAQLLGDEQTCLDDGGYHAYSTIDDPGFSGDVQFLSKSNEHYAIPLREGGKTLGLLHIMPAHRGVKTAELGYVLNKSFRRQSYMKEALRAVIDRLFKETGVKTITAKHDTENGKSGRVMQKAGMHLVEVRQKAAQNNLGLRDMAIYAIDNPYC